MNQSELAHSISKATGYKKHTVQKIMAGTFEEIAKTLETGDFVRIRNFGKFYPKGYRARRSSRCGLTGKVITVPARVRPRFQLSEALRQRVNSSLVALSDKPLPGGGVSFKKKKK